MASRKIKAFVGPMAAFIALLALKSALGSRHGAFWLEHAEYWIFPLQTVVCALILWWLWPVYQLSRPRQLAIGLAVGVVVFAIWISPQGVLGFPPRISGFNPDLFVAQQALYWGTVSFRFLRLVIVVPLVEEIFWRGFLLRYLINEKFDEVPFGTFSWLSFLAVTIAFTLSHSMADWPAAAITGALYNFVAYRTRSLSTCVVTHGVTNALLGLWIMWTKQWGFW
jgi:CAAX prenyl protease-like protein